MQTEPEVDEDLIYEELDRMRYLTQESVRAVNHLTQHMGVESDPETWSDDDEMQVIRSITENSLKMAQTLSNEYSKT